MDNRRFDVLGIGNAIVDVIATADDAFLAQESLNKGGMALIDEARAHQLYNRMGATRMSSGGSAANTIVGLASLGAKAAFIGKVKADETGAAFAHDIRAMGVHYDTTTAQEGPSTARCLVLVTPDGERTMNTYLGAAQNLSEHDVEEGLVAASAITYLEGYLWDPPAAKAAFIKAARVAHEAGGRVALSLSDPFCVGRYRDEFRDLIARKVVDIVFCNEEEAKSLFATADADSAASAFRDTDVLAVMTRGAQGSLIVSREGTCAVRAFPIDRLVDTTGAGDLFAAGFLAGLARGAKTTTCARLGALAAAEVIQHFGARPERDLRDLANENGLSV